MILKKKKINIHHHHLFLSPLKKDLKSSPKVASFYKILFLMMMSWTNLANNEAKADRLENEIAVFSALDKVTANIKKLEIPINQTAEFGGLKIKPFICYSSPPTEAPKTTSFIEIEEVQLDGQLKKIFSGWMFAESPGLNPVEHPVFDIWLTGCAKPQNTWSPVEGARREGARQGSGSPLENATPLLQGKGIPR